MGNILWSSEIIQDKQDLIILPKNLIIDIKNFDKNNLKKLEIKNKERPLTYLEVLEKKIKERELIITPKQ